MSTKLILTGTFVVIGFSVWFLNFDHSKLVSDYVVEVESETIGKTLSSDNEISPDENKKVEEPGLDVTETIAEMEFISQFPLGSQPIRNEQDFLRYKPNTSYESSMPFPTEDLSRVFQMSLATDRYQYFVGDVLSFSGRIEPVELGNNGSYAATSTDKQSNNDEIDYAVESNQVIQSIQYEVVNQSTGKRIQSGSVSQIDGLSFFDQIELLQSSHSSQLLPSQQRSSRQWSSRQWPSPQEWAIIVDAEIDGQTLRLSTPIRIEASAATLIDVSTSYVEGSELIIPLQMDVNVAGYYFVEANLYSASSQKPIIHLASEGPLKESQSWMNLKAHVAALKYADDFGPYLLKDFTISKAAEDHEEFDLNGHAANQSFPVEGYPISSFLDQPYVDEWAQAQLEFVKNLGN